VGEAADQVRHDIERTRAGLTDTFDEIGERVSPRRIVQRRTERVRDGFRSARETVMGTATSTKESATGTVSGVAGSVSGMAESADSTVTDVPDMARRQTEGNPLAAGLIAFGGGLLLASILPKTQAEQQAAASMQPQLDAVKEQAVQTGTEVKDQLASSAQEKVQQVKQAASDATSQVSDHASSVADDVKSEAQHGAEEVRSTATP
jgi:gas vesicle protein